MSQQPDFLNIRKDYADPDDGTGPVSPTLLAMARRAGRRAAEAAGVPLPDDDATIRAEIAADVRGDLQRDLADLRRQYPHHLDPFGTYYTPPAVLDAMRQMFLSDADCDRLAGATDLPDVPADVDARCRERIGLPPDNAAVCARIEADLAAGANDDSDVLRVELERLRRPTEPPPGPLRATYSPPQGVPDGYKPGTPLPPWPYGKTDINKIPEATVVFSKSWPPAGVPDAQMPRPTYCPSQRSTVRPVSDDVQARIEQAIHARPRPGLAVEADTRGWQTEPASDPGDAVEASVRAADADWSRLHRVLTYAKWTVVIFAFCAVAGYAFACLFTKGG